MQRMRRGNENRNTQGYEQGRGYTNQDDFKRPVKKSGCKVQDGYTNKSGEFVPGLLLTGWNKSQGRGFIKFIAAERKGKGETKAANQTCFAVKVQFSDGPKWFNGFYNSETKKMTIPDLEMVANPHAPNGGYFGKYYETK
jgi:hypothetical protein